MTQKLFGTDGIRGRANEYPITSEVAFKVGQAISHVLKSKGTNQSRVVIGKDTRISGKMLETALTEGLVSSGVDVILLGSIPTPAVAQLTKSLGCAAGVMLTASHNPYEDNGLKIFGPDGYKLSDDLEHRIEAEIISTQSRPSAIPAQVGKVTSLDDASRRYIDFAKQSAGKADFSGLKVVIDCGHGAAYQIAPIIFQGLGAQVIPLAVEPNGKNINEGVGALHPEFAGKVVKEQGADIGISFDGDADRVIFSDETGAAISGDRILVLCALALKQAGQLKNNTMVTTVMSNLGLHEVLREAGIQVVSSAVGDRHVIEALRKGNYSFGGENSGHLIFTDYATTGDGILSAIQILRMMKQQGKKISELAKVMHEYPSSLLNLKIKSKPPIETLTQLQKTIHEADVAFGKIGRHLIRYSGTENKIRILVEHREQSEVTAWTKRFQQALEKDLA
jgi:phosphoglucosamine mutase